ncbi:uncharacterized protein LOC143424070 [Xylocopa sonorina]|uniref:uncharacterized protein LOC143424070 n=1 Tax=Xylocopa sonorina TaxID=1818115 RepID=UPI00403AF250
MPGIKTKRSADYEWAVRLNRSSLEIVGLWPTEEDDTKEKFLTTLRAIVFLTVVTFVFTIPCLCDLIERCDNLMAAINNLGYSIPLMITLMKYIVVFKRKKVLLPIVSMIAEDWAKLKTELEEAVMIRRARVARAINIFGYTLITIMMSLMTILPRFGVTLRYVTNGTDVRTIFPLPTYYIYDEVSETPYFEIIYVVQATGMLMMTFCYTGIDNFFGLLVLHICGQLENLQTRLTNINDSESFNRLFAATIEDHIRLISAVNVIENTFTILLLALLLYFGTFVCIYGLLLITILVESEQISVLRVTFLIGTFVNTFVQTSLYCVAGQILVSQAEGVYNAAYECEWTNLKSKKAKRLILIMARAKRPLYITAGKLFPMTMLTFCKVRCYAFSFFLFSFFLSLLFLYAFPSFLYHLESFQILKISLGYVSFLLTKL